MNKVIFVAVCCLLAVSSAVYAIQPVVHKHAATASATTKVVKAAATAAAAPAGAVGTSKDGKPLFRAKVEVADNPCACHDQPECGCAHNKTKLVDDNPPSITPKTIEKPGDEPEMIPVKHQHVVEAPKFREAPPKAAAPAPAAAAPKGETTLAHPKSSKEQGVTNVHATSKPLPSVNEEAPLGNSKDGKPLHYAKVELPAKNQCACLGKPQCGCHNAATENLSETPAGESKVAATEKFMEVTPTATTTLAHPEANKKEQGVTTVHATSKPLPSVNEEAPLGKSENGKDLHYSKVAVAACPLTAGCGHNAKTPVTMTVTPSYTNGKEVVEPSLMEEVETPATISHEHHVAKVAPVASASNVSHITAGSSTASVATSKDGKPLYFANVVKPSTCACQKGETCSSGCNEKKTETPALATPAFLQVLPSNTAKTLAVESAKAEQDANAAEMKAERAEQELLDADEGKDDAEENKNCASVIIDNKNILATGKGSCGGTKSSSKVIHVNGGSSKSSSSSSSSSSSASASGTSASSSSGASASKKVSSSGVSASSTSSSSSSASTATVTKGGASSSSSSSSEAKKEIPATATKPPAKKAEPVVVKKPPTPAPKPIAPKLALCLSETDKTKIKPYLPMVSGFSKDAGAVFTSIATCTAQQSSCIPADLRSKVPEKFLPMIPADLKHILQYPACPK